MVNKSLKGQFLHLFCLNITKMYISDALTVYCHHMFCDEPYGVKYSRHAVVKLIIKPVNMAMKYSLWHTTFIPESYTFHLQSSICALFGCLTDFKQSPFSQVMPLGRHLGNASGQLFRTNKTRLLSK